MIYRTWSVNKNNEWTKGFEFDFDIEPVIGKNFICDHKCYKVNAIHPDKKIVYVSFSGYPFNTARG